MTEAEWLVAANPQALLEFVREQATDRKLRLYAVACGHAVEHELIDEGLQLLEACGAYADGRLEWGELTAYREAAKRPNLYGQSHSRRSGRAGQAALRATIAIAWGKGAPPAQAVEEVIVLCLEARRHSNWKRASEEFSHFLRDIFPFRPVSFAPSWRAPTVTFLAQTMYDARDFSAMPLLADALQVSGCDNAEVLNHCRGLGPHCRGCWVVDAILGKG